MSLYHFLIRKYNLELELESLVDDFKNNIIGKQEYLTEVDRIIDEKSAQLKIHNQKLNYKPEIIYNWENQSRVRMDAWFESLLGYITLLIEDDLYLRWKDLVSGQKLGQKPSASSLDQNNSSGGHCHDKNCANPNHHHDHSSKGYKIKAIDSENRALNGVNSHESFESVSQQDWVRQLENHFWHDLEHKFPQNLQIINSNSDFSQIILWPGILFGLGLSPAENILISGSFGDLIQKNPAKMSEYGSGIQKKLLDDEILDTTSLDRILDQESFGSWEDHSGATESDVDYFETDGEQINNLEIGQLGFAQYYLGEQGGSQNSFEPTLIDFLKLFGPQGVRFFYLYGVDQNSESIRNNNLKNDKSADKQKVETAEQNPGIELWNDLINQYNNILVFKLNDLVIRITDLVEQNLSGIVDWNREYEIVSSQNMQELERLKSIQKYAMDKATSDEQYQTMYSSISSEQLEQVSEELSIVLHENRQVGEVLKKHNGTELKLDLNNVYGHLYNFQTDLAFQALIFEFSKIETYLNQTKPWEIAKSYQNKEKEMQDTGPSSDISQSFLNFDLKSKKDGAVASNNWTMDQLAAREEVDLILSSAISGLKFLNDALAIFLPETAFRIYQVLDSDFVKKSPVLFEKIDSK